MKPNLATTRIQNEPNRLSKDSSVIARSVLYVCILMLAYSAPCACAQSSKSGVDSTAVRIIDFLNDLSSVRKVTTNSCVVVDSSGNFHMEVRLQELPSPVADLKIYEGTLSTSMREALAGLLNDGHLKDLPTFEARPIPTTSDFIKSVKVEIQRNNSIQQVGYVYWSEPSMSREVASTQEIEQKRTEATLQPLMGWFHHLQGSNLKETRTASTLCGERPFK